MTVIIDVTPGEEAWLAEQSAERGVPPCEIIKQLIDAQLPANAPLVAQATNDNETDQTQALFAQWAKEDTTPGLSPKALAAIAYLDARIEEGMNASPEEIRLADIEVEELMRNLKANREFSG